MSCRDFKELFLPAHSSVILRTVSTRRVQIVSRSGGKPSSRKLFLIHEFLLLRKTNSVSFKHRYVQIECEQMLSCKEPGGLFAICSQGNFPLWGNFRAVIPLAPPPGSPKKDVVFFLGWVWGSWLIIRRTPMMRLRESLYFRSLASDSGSSLSRRRIHPNAIRKKHLPVK